MPAGLAEYAVPGAVLGHIPPGKKGLSETMERTDNPRRAAAFASTPRSKKRASGRPDARLGPAHVRVIGLSLSEEDRSYIRQKLGMRLGRFARSIARLSVRVRDDNGPRGGCDLVCRVKVVLYAAPNVVVEGRRASLKLAIDAAIAGAERAVRRSVQRRRMKPIRSETGRRGTGKSKRGASASGL